MNGNSNWHSQQGTQWVEEPEVPLHGEASGHQDSMWHCVAVILSVQALVEAWEVWTVHWIAMKRHHKGEFLFARQGSTGLPLALWVDFPDCPDVNMGSALCDAVNSVQCRASKVTLDLGLCTVSQWLRKEISISGL